MDGAAACWRCSIARLTAGGGRLLKEWLRRPLRLPEAIAERHDAVGELLASTALRDRLRERLARLPDCERLAARAVLGTLSPREAAALRGGLREAPGLLADLSTCAAPLLARMAAVDPLADLAGDLERTLAESPPASLEDGGVIAEGVDAELDACVRWPATASATSWPSRCASASARASRRSRSATTGSSATTWR